MNYYNMLNEAFDKMLNEARQDEINFRNVFGDSLLARFKTQKPRMHAPENDFYYWIRKSRENLDDAIHELDAFISNLENTRTRSEKRRAASEGAEVMFENEDWLVLWIKTYEAAAKYGAGTTWCITGRYPGHESRGEHYFNMYREDNGWEYYFYIKKNEVDEEGRQEKWCLCYADDHDWCIYNAEDDNITDDGYGIEGAPQVPGLPDVSEPNDNYSEEDAEEDEWGPEEGEGGEHHHREPEPAAYEIIDVENPNSMEFPARSKEEAARMFKDGAEIVDTVREPDLFIAKWHEEPTDEGDAGDRFALFVFIPGEGGGPLLAQTGRGFGLQVFKDLEKAKEFAAGMPGVEIRNNREETEDMPECLKENFYYYNDNSWYYDL